ncbi:hypothetical protein N431DRAFT_464902 [Stipitochalara longipes BDJ]|nr:hypothetical protein N431DRAFT_464902 [Stipitochalara longipes BDJ]
MHSFNYLVPALFWNATVNTVFSSGNLSTGGGLRLGVVTSATLRSEPGFEPSFTAQFAHGVDFITTDPGTTGISRPDLTGLVLPDDGSTPFQMHATGIQIGNQEVAEIALTNSTKGLKMPYGAVYSVWVPTFRGGSDKYANLQNSIFIASETISDSSNPNEFFVGLKISKVFNTNTSIIIGNEFP